MKKTIYILVSFGSNDYEFKTEVFGTLEEAREEQWKWLEGYCEFLGLKVPTKDEMYEGESELFYYSEDAEYMSILPANCLNDAYSTIEIKEITI